MAIMTDGFDFLSFMYQQDYLFYIKSFVLSTFIYFVLVTLYRLTLHPLAKFPGSFLSKISGWPHIYHCYVGDRHLWTYALHEKHGSIIRTGPNMLSFNTSSAIAALHTDRHANVKKSDWYKLEPAESGAYSVQTVIDKKEHAWRRRVIAPAFSVKALRDQEDFIIENTNILLKQLTTETASDGWSKSKDISVWTTYFGFDFISDIAFGSSFGLLESSDHHYLPAWLMWTSQYIYYAAYFPFVEVLGAVMGSRLRNLIPSQAAQDTHKFFGVALKKLGEREEEEKVREKTSDSKNSRKDLFHYLYYSRDPETGRGFTQEQLHADSTLFLAAGADGVAITVSAALFYMLKNPATLQKLTQELRSSFGSVDEIKTPKINELTYLSAIVEETVRICPGAPSAFPREVLQGGVTVDNVYIPAGTVVGVNPYATHHNETYFPESFVFHPERWIGQEDRKIKEMKAAMFAFSSGPYGCIGKGLAIMASKIVLARLLYTYDIRAPGGKITGGGGAGKGLGREKEDEYQMIDWVVGYRTGPDVQLKPTS